MTEVFVQVLVVFVLLFLSNPGSPFVRGAEVRLSAAI
jgi:hypothetical protein